MRTYIEGGKYIHAFYENQNIRGVKKLAKELGITQTDARNLALANGLERTFGMGKKMTSKKATKKTTPKKK